MGVGLMGRRHAENVARLGGARVVAVFDAALATRQRVAGELGAVACSSLDELLAREDLRAVIVASPAATHEAGAVAAARAGKDVFVEKPIAATLAGADNVIEAARASGVRLQVGFQRRYDPVFAKAREIVRGGALGRPVYYRGINRDRDAPAGRPGSLPRGDILTESAIHDLDGACWMLSDEPIGVRATLATVHDPRSTPAPDLALVQMRFASGALADIETMRGARYGYDIRGEILCERGAVMVGGFAQTMLTVLGEGERRQDLFAGFLERYADAYLAEVRDFVDGVTDRRAPAVSGDEGKRALAIALAAERAASDGVEVTIARRR
ncbi:MAG TPA: Gfo/Idh/MocA family oxidoreductase [Candidatus Limnocylindria bacterium]|jgi:scyllo-inositol 2-dehydrogenase (NAD+)|nr:Gfo/Idh/MocA family oxidoreductase [Candidatus Limnocylindria bacterium]